MKVIVSFKGKHAVLSNSFLDPVMLDDVFYPSITNAVQASKFPKEKRRPFTLCDPQSAVKMGASRKWTEETTEVLYAMLEQKFRPGFRAWEALRATGDAILYDANTAHQNITGGCICQRCANVEHRNLVGEYLMKLRDADK